MRPIVPGRLSPQFDQRLAHLLYGLDVVIVALPHALYRLVAPLEQRGDARVFFFLDPFAPG